VTQAHGIGVQDQYAPRSICFGCGPANPKGLQIKSRWEGEQFVARFQPKPEHQAFSGIVNGGIIGTLLDCHGNWCAAMTLLKERGLSEAPSTVTSEFHVKLRRPTPVQELTVLARAVSVEGDKVTIEAELKAGDQLTATCRGVFVAVKPGHPAYHRWD
jgi:acyl-coenzyme A thioesterase PaaI-like protein